MAEPRTFDLRLELFDSSDIHARLEAFRRDVEQLAKAEHATIAVRYAQERRDRAGRPRRRRASQTRT